MYLDSLKIFMKKGYLILIGIYLLVYIAPLGVRPLISQDETRYAEISREMIETGDWVVPRLNGVRYFEKPVLGYWLTAASIMVFGENAFAVRFPSALAVGMTAMMLVFMIRRFSGDRQAAFYAASVFLTTMLVFSVGTFCVLDSMFSAFVTAGMTSFFYAYSAGAETRKKILYLLIFGVFAGVAFLTKGFLAFVLPAVIIGPFLLWERKIKELAILPWLPLLTAIGVILPWALLIHSREPDFWNYFFWTENIHRFASEDAQHKEPFLYYILWLPAAVFPWTFQLPEVIQGLNKNHFKTPLIRYAVCWAVFPLLFFSASEGKLLTYILPCFPAVAVLAATGLNAISDDSGSNLLCCGAYAASFLMAILAAGLAIVQAGICKDTWPYCNDTKWLIVVVSVSFTAILFYLSGAVRNSRWKIKLFTVAPVVVMFCAHFSLPDSVIPSKAPGAFLLGHRSDVTPDTVIVSDQKPFHAVCWYFKRKDLFFLENCGELEYGISYEDSKRRMLDFKGLRRLIRLNSGNVLLILTPLRFERISKYLPKPSHADTNGRIVMAWF
jgi:4-amino-4-deoxy-L-arabinose transferase